MVRTWGPLAVTRLKVGKIEPLYQIVITNDPEKIAAEIGELLDGWEEQARQAIEEEVRRRLEEE